VPGARAPFALLAAALLAAACTPPVTTRHGISDQAPDGEALRQLQEEMAPYRKRGAGVVTGHVSIRGPAGEVAARAGSRVLLAPATSYAVLRFESFVVADNELPPAVRAAAVKHGNTDAQGNFTLRDLPPGGYLIASEMFWTSPDGASRSDVPFARFEIHEGATTVEVAVTRSVSARDGGGE